MGFLVAACLTSVLTKALYYVGLTVTIGKRGARSTTPVLVGKYFM